MDGKKSEKQIYWWRGKKFTDMTKEELIAVIQELHEFYINK